ncbi:MAG: glycosyltransferase family 39 protein, partial [Anaerolineae bacterium]|nr:glycosyltransferase family 39 protein [Anaerolineae bacterium]
MESEHQSNSKYTRRDLIILVVLSLLVNGIVALLVSDPNYVDAFYYFNGGLALAEGNGFIEPYFWNTIGAPVSLPAPAFGYWQPLPSFLAMLGILLFGKASAFGSAQAIFVLAASALPVISYRIALRFGERRHAWLAGLLTVFSGIYVVYWSLPETFTLFVLSGAGALLLAARARRSGKKWWRWLLAGVCAGLGYLCRADGLLL